VPEVEVSTPDTCPRSFSIERFQNVESALSRRAAWRETRTSNSSRETRAL